MPSTEAFEETVKPVVTLDKANVWVESRPTPVKLEPSPMNDPAVTLPVTTAFEEMVKPVVTLDKANVWVVSTVPEMFVRLEPSPTK